MSGSLQFAQAYAALGWPVLPVEPGGKRPLHGQGIDHATTDVERIRDWFTKAPGANIGIRLDVSGLVAVDIDPRNGGRLELAQELPPTLTARTGGGGLHLLYRVRKGETIPGKLAHGVDLKHRGYIVVEPSKHPSGGAYCWLDWDVLRDGAPSIAEAPTLAAVPGTEQANTDDADKIGPGRRNDFLSKRAYAMRRAGLDVEEIAPALLALNELRCNPPLPDTEVRAIAAGKAAIATVEEWPIPQPLPDALPAVEPFDAELMPATLRPWVMDIAHRMQCPADFPAVAALVALSSLIGARAVIQPKARDDWQVVPNLWGACIGRPGVKKSPALGEALKPLHRLQRAEHDRWQVLHEAWELDAKVSELAKADREKKAKGLAGKDPAQARALLQADGDGQPEPVQRRFIVNDATVEKLGELLVSNEWGTLSYRDELYGLLTSMDRQGQEGARAFYLQGFDGNGGYTFDRIGRGTIHIPRVCLAMLGGIQPGRIQDYVRGAVAGGSADDGLLQRFGLTVWPDADADYVHVDQWPDTPARQAAWAVFERLAQLEPGADGEPDVWLFTPEAQAIFAQWLVPFESELRRDDLHPALVSHLAKYRKLIPALALIFAMIDTPNSGGIVGEQELVRALAWGDYLRSHAQRLYAAAVVPESAGARTLLAKIKAGKLTDTDGVLLDTFTPRQVAQKCWTGLGTAEAVRKAADVLVDWDYLRAEALPTGPAGGRPSEHYRINPRVIGGGCA